MSKHKLTNGVCIAIVACMVALTVAFMLSRNFGVTEANIQPAYTDKLFSTDEVHTIDIQVEESDWNDMIANAQAEEYVLATVVIDGETISGVGLRPKGNSSLSTIARTDSDRYSFKIEFDHYSNKINYHGLDKLALNNISQDNTYMKDYISYQMMNDMGADAPLSSFIWVTVNGEDWGLYLAAEGIEESFAARVYGNDYGEIYKPDSMDLNNGGMNGEGGMPNFGGENGEMPQMPDWGGENGEMPNRSGEDGEIPQMPNFEQGQTTTGEQPERGQGRGNMGGGFGGMGGSGTSLTYVDDDPDSYSTIFDNAVFKAKKADKERLIASLKQLNEQENIDQVVDVDEVIRYFAVHNFVLNSDSYTGSIVHNYYLAENDGVLSMIAWDYNLAFGGMGAGMGGGMGGFGANARNAQTNDEQATAVDTATQYVNYPIDSPMLSGSIEDKPMIAWIFDNEEYLEKYHAIFSEYMEYFESGEFAEMYDNAITLISPYVEKDPTAFCTYEDFQTGSSALKEFCLLRAESISGQLDGAIASTSDEQTATNNANFVDASAVDMESMGSNSMGFGRARGGDQFQTWNRENAGASDSTETATGETESIPNNGQQGFPGGGAVMPSDGQAEPPEGGGFPQMTANENPTERDAAEQAATEANGADNTQRAFANMGVRPQESSDSTALPSSTIIMLGVCAVALFGGVVFAMWFGKKRKV